MATTLKRTLSLPLVAMYGLGNILGAGIYVLVGKVAGFAGTSTVLAFLVAMTIAGLTACSYMELAGRYPVSASVSVYLHKAFGRRWLSVLIGLAMVAGGITSAAALAQGFGGYLSTFLPVPIVISSIGILVLIGLLALRGIGESAKVAGLFALAEILGLVIIIWAGSGNLAGADVSAMFHIDPSVGLGGIILGAFLAFYAFIGFEDMVNVAEETKNPRRTMPLAILVSLITATVLYLLVVIVSLSVVSPAELAASEAPLSLVFQKASRRGGAFIGAIGIAAAVNGIIVQVVMGSRVLYGLAKQGWLHHELKKVHKVRKTPMLATTIVVGLMILATFLLPLVSLAQLTSLLVLAIFALVNIALLKVKRDQPKHPGFITVPKLIPILGAFSCGSIIIYQIISSAA